MIDVLLWKNISSTLVWNFCLVKTILLWFHLQNKYMNKCRCSLDLQWCNDVPSSILTYKSWCTGHKGWIVTCWSFCQHAASVCSMDTLFLKAMREKLLIDYYMFGLLMHLINVDLVTSLKWNEPLCLLIVSPSATDEYIIGLMVLYCTGLEQHGYKWLLCAPVWLGQTILYHFI